MGLSSLQLEAFVEVARSGTFSSASRRLGLSQPALSQRVLNLESELGVTLFVRAPSGLRLTETGQRLLRHVQTQQALENEVLEQLRGSETGRLAGRLRVGAYSSVLRSLLLPVLAGWARAHPDLQLELIERELRELPGLLQTGQADIILLDRALPKSHFENEAMGLEKNVLVQAKPKGKAKEGLPRAEVFLDHDEEDSTTFDFLRLQKKKIPADIRRSYLGDIYALIDGVRAGLGRAVIPRHLLAQFPDLEIVPDYKALEIPVYLVHHRQAFYTKLQAQALEVLRTSLPPKLVI